MASKDKKLINALNSLEKEIKKTRSSDFTAVKLSALAIILAGVSVSIQAITTNYAGLSPINFVGLLVVFLVSCYVMYGVFKAKMK